MKQKKHNSGMVKWQFDGFYNWPAGEGWIDLVQYMNLQRATFYGSEKYDFLTENFCRDCICWREAGTCRRVLVQYITYRGDAWHCCCPILFFDFIGIKLPELVVSEQEPVMG